CKAADAMHDNLTRRSRPLRGRGFQSVRGLDALDPGPPRMKNPVEMAVHDDVRQKDITLACDWKEALANLGHQSAAGEQPAGRCGRCLTAGVWSMMASKRAEISFCFRSCHSTSVRLSGFGRWSNSAR